MTTATIECESALVTAVRERLAALAGDVGLALRIGDTWVLGRGVLDVVKTWSTADGIPVVASAPACKTAMLDTIEPLVDAVQQLCDMQGELEGLYDELGTSYESLSSIYEIGSDPTLLLHPEEALRKIIDRALAFETDLQAVFWLVNGEQLEPAQWRNTNRPEPRRADAGLIGRALAEQRGIIINERAQSESEPELSGAARVVVSPMMCRDAAIGALVVWHEAPGSFDSRLMGLLTSLSSQAAMILEQDRLRQETVEGERLKQEVEISGVIQKTLLLGHAPKHWPRLTFGTVAHASRQIDGDFFGFFPQSEDVIDVLVADVMGKGIPAALVGAGVKSQFLRFASTQKASGGVSEPVDPTDIVTAVHDAVADQLMGIDKFVTAVYARLAPHEGRMIYVDCGHTEVLHYRAAGDHVVKLRVKHDSAANLPLGFLPNCPYPQAEVAIANGDCLCFYSDGITEATNEKQQMFGVDALANTIARNHTQTAQELADTVHAAVTAFASEDGVNDDLTCIVVKVAAGFDTIEFPAESGHLEEVRDFATRVCRGAGADERIEAEVHLALTEAITNVVRHAYDAEPGIVRVEGEPRKGRLEFRVFDGGKPFDPGSVPGPAFDGTRDGGFGVFIIDKIMDDVRYTRDDNGINRLELIKRFERKGETNETRQ